MSLYEEEVQARWGDTDAYRQSTSKTSKYSKQDFVAAKVDQEAATELFVYAFGNSLPIDSPKTKRRSLLIGPQLQNGFMTAPLRCKRTWQ